MRVSCYRIVVLALLLIFSLVINRVQAQYFVLNFPDDIFLSDFDNNSTNAYSDDGEFGQTESISEQEVDPGSWRPIFELNNSSTVDLTLTPYYSGLQKIISAASEGNTRLMEEAVTELEASASAGDLHAKSVMGFVYGIGMIRETSEAKSFQQHQLAAEGGDMQSKMALAYRYIRLDLHDKAARLYRELAETTFNRFMISKDYTTFVPIIRIHRGTYEDKNMLRKFHGEDSEDFKIVEHYAQIGYPSSMYRVGLFYYFGMRGLRRDHAKGVYWFSKAAEKGELNSMGIMGDIYSRGAGVERNYTKALQCLTLAAEQGLYSAFNGLGYLYLKGYGVAKNYTKAREYFEKAADSEDLSGMYYLGMLYLKGIGVKRDVKQATKYFLVAANAELPKAIYQMAKMLHVSARIKNNLNMLKLAAALYKSVAERGPWSSLSRWALESYVKGDLGKAFILYSRMAELGYEVAQSNAAWILHKYGEKSMCMGVSGFCMDKERHERAHDLWLRASKQGNDYAALLVGDAYYYGRGKERDFVRATEAYMYATSLSNAQAMFNLGYMHEYGQGIPYDLNLAKSYYNQALENEPVSKLPNMSIMLAFVRLWVHRNYVDISIMVTLLLASIIIVLHLRERRRHLRVLIGSHRS
ncbi:PREDICTED: ERAD-associated E3 ubiquitin-protein ligase component HRD3A-like [Camelina sativa]|uniref:ERAD-associated E3 ubiquitin-protein ligase component HRD3A-like n=1 Tax=Camelina sativa TaxID=90675 RepID=A0ABM0SU44_CAMSA|nr:PREDICTED: ERAD-associated E3 ubiquitin-protein ligase component HRD3A-like [Camelina sativa]